MRSIFPLLLLAHSASALVLPAQGRYALGAYISRNGALPESPTLGGAALTIFAAGPLGVRAGGGLNLLESGAARTRESRSGIGAWTADADLVLSPSRGLPVLASVLRGFAPFGFVGVGVEGLRSPDEPSEAIGTWSYGFGASRRLLAGLSVDADARYRMPLVDAARLPEGFSSAWEYRIGLVINFGGRVRTHGRSRGEVPRFPPHETVASASAAQVLTTAERYLGAPYLYGGTTPERGFDCSGFVQHVFARHGVPLPRTSRQQALAGRSVLPVPDALAAGDLVLFAGNGTRVDHVAIYAGGGRIIHSTSSGGGVRYDDLSTPRGRWFLEHMVAARRVIADGAKLVEPPAVAQIAPESLDPPDLAPEP